MGGRIFDHIVIGAGGMGSAGHGFKFCSGIGEILADLSIHSATRHDTDLFSLSRSVLTGTG